MSIQATFDEHVVNVTYKLEARNGPNVKLGNPLVEVPEVVRFQIQHHRDQLCRQLSVTLGPKLDPDGSALCLYSDEIDIDNPIQQFSEVKFTMRVFHADGTFDDVVLFWGYILDITPSGATLDFVANDKLFRIVHATCVVDQNATEVIVPLVGGVITLQQVAGITTPDYLEVNPVTHPTAWNPGATARRGWKKQAYKLSKNGVEMKPADYLIEMATGRIQLRDPFAAAVWTINYLTVYQEGTNEVEDRLVDAFTYPKGPPPLPHGGPGFLVGDCNLAATGITAARVHWSHGDGTVEEFWRQMRRDLLPANYVVYYDPNADQIIGRYAYQGEAGAGRPVQPPLVNPPAAPLVPDCTVNARRAIDIDTPRNIDGVATRIIVRAQSLIHKGITEELNLADFALCTGVGDIGDLLNPWNCDAGECIPANYAKLTDNNLTNRVRYFKDIGGNDAGPPWRDWFTINLGVATTITEIVATATGTDNDQRFPWYLSIQGSTVGIGGPWSDLVKDEQLDPNQTANLKIDADQSYQFILIRMQACKDVHGGGERSVALAELQIYGSTEIEDSATGTAPEAKVVDGVLFPPPPIGSPDILDLAAFEKAYYTVGFVTKMASELDVLSEGSAKEFAHQYLNETIRVYQKVSVECSLTTEIGLWSYVEVIDPFNIHAGGNQIDVLVEEFVMTADRIRFTGVNYAAGIIS